MSLDEIGAHYDIEKDLIVGANEGSLAWHHENAHKKLMKIKCNKIAYSFINGAIPAAIGALCLVSEFTELKVFGFLLFAWILAQEIAAWLIAFRDYRAETKAKLVIRAES